MFLCYGSTKLDQHPIHPDSCLSSDHAPLSTNIPINKEVVCTLKLSIPQRSELETTFIKEIISNFKNLNMSNIADTEKLEHIVNSLGVIIDQAWTKNAKDSEISKHSKQWWIDECSYSLNNYRMSRSLDNWKNFKKVVKNTKRSFFDMKIQEVAGKSCSPWELINWISRCKLPATKAIKYNSHSYFSLESLWKALHNTFNTALNHQVDSNILSKIKHKSTSCWSPFSKEEFKQVISKYNDLSLPGPNKLT